MAWAISEWSGAGRQVCWPGVVLIDTWTATSVKSNAALSGRIVNRSPAGAGGWFDLDEAEEPGDDLQPPRGVPVVEAATDRGFRVGMLAVGQRVVADDVASLGEGFVDDLLEPAGCEVHRVAGPEDAGVALPGQKAGLAEDGVADAQRRLGLVLGFGDRLQGGAPFGNA